MPQYIVAHYFKRELYIASANLTNLDLSEIGDVVPESKIWKVLKYVRCADVI
jgi:hypothetical protein